MTVCGRFNSFSLVSVLPPTGQSFGQSCVCVETEKVHSDMLVESGCVRNVSVGKVQC